MRSSSLWSRGIRLLGLEFITKNLFFRFGNALYNLSLCLYSQSQNITFLWRERNKLEREKIRKNCVSSLLLMGPQTAKNAQVLCDTTRTENIDVKYHISQTVALINRNTGVYLSQICHCLKANNWAVNEKCACTFVGQIKGIFPVCFPLNASWDLRATRIWTLWDCIWFSVWTCPAYISWIYERYLYLWNAYFVKLVCYYVASESFRCLVFFFCFSSCLYYYHFYCFFFTLFPFSKYTTSCFL